MSAVYEAAQRFLEARQQVRRARQQQDNARLTLQEAQASLGEAFSQASDEVVGDAPELEEQLAGLNSFTLVEGSTATTLVFCQGHLHSVIESPILQPPSSP